MLRAHPLILSKQSDDLTYPAKVNTFKLSLDIVSELAHSLFEHVQSEDRTMQET
jgi:hypothetical protein